MYVQTFLTADKRNLISLLPLLEQETKVTHVILASLHLHDKPGIMRLNDDALDSPIYTVIWEEVKILQENGIKVMALLGGAAAGSYKRLNGTESEFYSYYHPLLRLIQQYNLDGLDIDIEELVDISVPLRLINALHRDLGPSFLITMTPIVSALASETEQNLSGFSYFELDALATVPGSDKKLVAWYNTMFYGHFQHGPPPYEAVMEAGWDPERVVMGVLDSRDGGQPNTWVGVEGLMERIWKLKRAYPGFGGIAGWEYFDAGSSEKKDLQPWEWVKRVGEVLFDDIFTKTDL